MLTWNATVMETMLPSYRGFAAATSADAAALAARLGAWDDELDDVASADAVSSPWWLCNSRAALLTRADAHLLLMRRMLVAHSAGVTTLRAGPASSVDLAASERWTDAIAALTQLVTVGQAALLQARLAGRDQAQLSVAAEVVAALAAVARRAVGVGECRRDFAAARERSTSLWPLMPPPVLSVGPGGGAAGTFWPAFAAVAQGQAVPTARGAHPHLAVILETAVRSVLAGEAA